MTEGASPARPLLLVLAYLPLVGLIPLLLAKNDPEVRWHARNGTLLFAAVVAAALLATLVGIVVPSSSCLYAAVMVVVACLYVGIALLAIVMALTGQRLMIPGISRRASRLAASR
ncbi:MAG TPA: hypothetical protein VGH97_00225 [Thermoanaerobaculia bacterium]|jgi:uncharacterized membrane protein